MPATFPSHAAAVLPLKLWRPDRFDGVALVVGSVAPDLLYPLLGLVPVPVTHTAGGLLWFALPVTLVLTRVVRWAAPAVAVHLPGWLSEYSILGAVRHPWRVTVWSALLGALSHVVWDSLTHTPIGGGWLSRRIDAVQREGLFGLPWWTVTDNASTVVGALGALGVLVHVGRRRLLRDWHGTAPVCVAPVPLRFWLTVSVVASVYLWTWPTLPYRGAPHVQGVRMLWAVGLGLVLGAAVARRSDRAGWRGDRVPDRTRHDG